MKYADDVDLLVPEHSSVDLSWEFSNIKDWAAKNNMIINFQKTKELVFRHQKLKPREHWSLFTSVLWKQ